MRRSVIRPGRWQIFAGTRPYGSPRLPSGGQIRTRLASASLAGTRPCGSPRLPSGGQIRTRLASASLAGTRPCGSPRLPSGGQLRTRLASASLAVLLAAAGCGRDPDKLELFFADELVEAPARTLHLLALQGSTCDAVLSVPHERAATTGAVLLDREGRFPLNPEGGVLEVLPRGVPFVLTVAAFDAADVLIARACDAVTLEPDTPTELLLELRALPYCPAIAPALLDLVLVLDTSTAMAIADPEKTHLTELKSRVVDGGRFPEGSTWTIVTHGHTSPPAEVLPPTSDTAAIKTAIDDLFGAERNTPLLYDAIAAATAAVRARAVCGRRPALLVLAGGPDEGSTALFEDATVGMVGTRGDPTDDIFTFGLALTRGTYDVLAELIPAELGTATGAETEFLRQSKLSEAAATLRALVP